MTGGLGGMRPIIVCDPNLLQAARSPDREHLGPAADVRRDGRHVAVVCEAAVPLRQLGVHAGRPRNYSRTDVQREPGQAVLFLFARSAAADRSLPREQHHAVGAGTQRRLLADEKLRRPAALHPESVQRIAVQREHRRRRLLPGQCHPAEHDQPDGSADHEPVPAAGPGARRQSGDAGELQLPVRGGHGKAAARQRHPRRLERRSKDNVLHPSSSSRTTGA
jgi:hypothetical protein